MAEHGLRGSASPPGSVVDQVVYAFRRAVAAVLPLALAGVALAPP